MDKIYTKEELLDMYRNLKFGRLFTLKMHEAVYKGLIRSSFHTPYGQEAIGVGVVSAMRKTDWLAYTHFVYPRYSGRHNPHEHRIRLGQKNAGQGRRMRGGPWRWRMQ